MPNEKEGLIRDTEPFPVYIRLDSLKYPRNSDLVAKKILQFSLALCQLTIS